MTNALPIRTSLALLAVVCVAGTHASTGPAAPTRTPQPASVRVEHLTYRATGGRISHATVLLPSSYDAARDRALPLVISPHGRGVDGDGNARLWGDLPALGDFAVVNPDGTGQHLSGRFAWGAPDDIADLARMPQLVERSLGIRIDRRRVYAVGGSMGAQETLLLIARHPKLLAGAVAVDAATDFGRQYRNFAQLHCRDASCTRNWGGDLGQTLQRLAQQEVGGTPTTAPAAFAQRSPLTYARQIAASGVPLQIWWSRTDRVIRQSRLQSGRLVADLRRLHPRARLTVINGRWRHTHPLRYDRELPQMLARLGLLEVD
jgi:dipeptidyl aminopeptidase/acylaminoacyl peptidase